MSFLIVGLCNDNEFNFCSITMLNKNIKIKKVGKSTKAVTRSILVMSGIAVISSNKVLKATR